MQELLDREVPTSDTAAVRSWLQERWSCPVGVKIAKAEGIAIEFGIGGNTDTSEERSIPQISVFVWSVNGRLT